MFNPYDWYWLADDGRVAASARSKVIGEADADYINWMSGGGVPTRWPVDEHGQQTEKALQDVLTAYGLFATLKTYAANKRWQLENAGVSIDGKNYPTDPVSQSKFCAAALLAMIDDTQTFRWKTGDGTFTSDLTAAQMIVLAKYVGSHVNGLYKTEDQVIEAIDAGTIQTKADVDEAFAA